jgi:hypothetical protein
MVDMFIIDFRTGNSGLSEGQFDRFSDSLKVRKQRQKPRPMSSQTLSRIISKNPLSPTVEEHTLEDPLRQNHNRGSIKTTSINPAGSSDKDIEQPLTAVASPSLIGKESLSEAEMKTSLTKAMSPLARQGQTQQSFFEADIKLPRATARPLATETSVEDITRVKAKRATPPKNTQPKFQRDSSDKESEPPISNLAVIPPRSKGLSYGNCQPYPGHFKAGTRGTKDTPGLDRSPSTSPKQHTDPREPQQIAPSASHQLSPEITMSRASSRVLESRVSSHARRIAASEPGQRLTLPVRSHRTSKSTLDDSRRRSARAGASQFGSSKDPLTRVSREEDIASLATLARALDVLDKSTEADVKLGIADDSRSNNDSLVVHAPAYRQPIAADAQSGSQASAIRHGPPNIHAPSSDSKKLPNSERIIPQERQEHGTVSSLGQKSITPNNKSTVNPTSPKTPQQRQVVSSTKGNYGPPRGNVKALAAKFNTADSPPSVPPAAKSPTKSLRMDTQSRFESPKDNLVAPYTTNPPSPTRSQKSGISDKTPRSVRNLMPVDRNSSRTAGSTPAKESSAVKVSGSDEHASPIKDSSLNKKSTPCRVLKSSLKDPTPLRPVPKSIEGNSVCLASTLVNSSSQRSVSLKPVNISAASDVRISATFIYPAPLKRVQASAPMKVPTNMLGGPAGSINFGTVMPRPDPPPVAHHISFARPQSAGAVVEKTDIPNSQPLADDTNPVPGPIGPVAIPAPGRSNSMLHGQIRSLQRQLIAKDEELRQLRQQLDTRGNLDIGTLSEHLMKAKREIQTWKARAEVAEKQVEVMTKLSSRSSSRQVKALNQSFQSSANYSEDGAVVADRIRRALHGMDGAASERGTSEESSDTVIRDIREAVTGSEYSIWMEQTMNSLEDAVPYKLE